MLQIAEAVAILLGSLYGPIETAITGERWRRTPSRFSIERKGASQPAMTRSNLERPIQLSEYCLQRAFDNLEQLVDLLEAHSER